MVAWRSPLRRMPSTRIRMSLGNARAPKVAASLASPRGSIELHLHEPVLRRDETLRAKEVGRIRRENVRYAKLVAEHRHRRVESRELHAALRLRLPGGAQPQADAEYDNDDRRRCHAQDPLQRGGNDAYRAGISSRSAIRN